MAVTSIRTRQRANAQADAPTLERAAPPRERYHHGDLPAAIKRAAVTLIARHGVDGFSLREAAMAVGVSPSAAYRHFADKAALLGAIAADAFFEMGQRFEEATRAVRGSSARAARARFLAQGRAYVAFALEQPERFSVMFGPYGAGSACLQAADGAHGHATPYAALSRALDELVNAGVVSPSRRTGAELMAWSAIHGLATLLVSKALVAERRGVDAMVDRIGDDCLRAMAEPPVR